MLNKLANKSKHEPMSIQTRPDKCLSGEVIAGNCVPSVYVPRLLECGYANPFGQSGVVLVISLIMLLLLTLIGLSGMQSTIIEEKMAGNLRDRNLAFNAAEAAIRDAENDIRNQTRMSQYTGFSPDCGVSTPQISDDGLCSNGLAGYPVSNPIWNTVNWSGPGSVEYGDQTGAAEIAGLAAQPRYIIETLNQLAPATCVDAARCYRITARAVGANPNTVVMIQTIFKPFDF